jgi:WD40 repeat protein
VPGELMIGPAEPVWADGSNGDLACAGDGRTIAFAGTTGAFVVTAGQPDSQRKLAGHADPRYVAITGDGRWVATGSHNGTNVNVWDATTGRRVRELPVGRSRVAFSPDGQWLATASDGLSLWTVRDWKQVWQGAGQYLSAHAFTADGRFIAVETGSGTIVLYATRDGREIARLADPHGRLQMWLVFSPDSRFLAGISHDSKGLTVWDVQEVENRLERMGAGAERVSLAETAGDTRDFPLKISTPFNSDSEAHAESDSPQTAPGDGPHPPGESGND